MWLRRLAPPLRYGVYAAGALLVFSAAIGLGAAASLVVRWQSESTQAGYGDYTAPQTLEGTTETTGTKMLEGTAIAPDGGGAESTTAAKPAEDDTYVHTATDENSRGDYTYISDPAIDGDPDAVVLVEPPPDQEGASGYTYDHNIGVWYDFVDRERWAIFNQDRTAVPAGTTFRVVLPQASERFVHRADLVNTVDNVTYLNDPLTDGEPDAVLSVTQNWNPGGGAGVYNDHPVAVFYDEDVQQWAISNQDGAPIPDGAAFNVAVSEEDVG